MAFLLHHLLTESARRQPDAEAVRLVDRALNYGELDRLSSQVAHLLIGRGVGRSDRVGLYLNKSPEAIAAIFGIMKTGACYVPVDANAPGMRLQEIGRQCVFKALVTSRTLYEKLDGSFHDDCAVNAILFVDEAPPKTLPVPAFTFAKDLPSQPAIDPGVPAIDNDLAYILFTSGSTGVPKGVMLSHRNALTFVDWACETFEVTAQDRLSQHAPFNFDLSVFDIYVAIKAGAAISLVPEGSAVFPLQLAKFIQDQKITIWYSVPMVLTLLHQRGKLEERDFSALRWILFAGEVFPTKHLRALMEKLPGKRYANLYGPTETNVCAWYEVELLAPDATAPIPIGKACANTDLIPISAEGDRVVGPGKEGLLYARGATVMQGYWGRPEASAASFIPNPFVEGREERLYCTGDWVTIDADGNYLFVGRKDHMIKTRGYRVELGEIEAVIVAHSAVDEAVAVPVPDEAIGNTIHAVVTLADSNLTDVATLKQHCAEKLPAYMVPEKIHFRDSLPRTDNGKVDRRRLQGELTAVT